MARRTQDYKLKRAISIRIQSIIEERFDSLYRFSQTMEALGKNALASTVRGWLPPQKLWKEKPDGRAVGRVDWEAVKIPDCSTLIEFCEILSVRADFILRGDGEASQSQSRAPRTLDQDVSVHIAEALKFSGHFQWTPEMVDGRRALRDIVEAAKKEAKMWMDISHSAPARLAADDGMLLEEILRLAALLPHTPEASLQARIVLQYGALFEAFAKSSPSGYRKLGTKYLDVPSFGDDGPPLPSAQMEAQIDAAIQRLKASRES